MPGTGHTIISESNDPPRPLPSARSSPFIRCRAGWHRAAAPSLIWMALLAPGAANAVPDFGTTCDEVAWRASVASGVPISVMKAITRTETGRKRGKVIQPWPWTVNMEGKGVWFDSRDEALAYATESFDRGARSFDVGCFQINYKWHGEAFASIEEMFDPMANATYAAKFVTELYAETGSWSKAAGAYHSRTPTNAERYAARFDRFRKEFLVEDGAEAPDLPIYAETGVEEIPEIPDIVLALGGEAAAPRPGEGEVRLAVVRVNTYPLLQTGGGGGLGSLVPIGNGAGISMFGTRPLLPDAGVTAAEASAESMMDPTAEVY